MYPLDILDKDATAAPPKRPLCRPHRQRLAATQKGDGRTARLYTLDPESKNEGECVACNYSVWYRNEL